MEQKNKLRVHGQVIWRWVGQETGNAHFFCVAYNTSALLWDAETNTSSLLQSTGHNLSGIASHFATQNAPVRDTNLSLCSTITATQKKLYFCV